MLRSSAQVRLGALSIVAGLAANRWTLGALLAPDGTIESPTFLGMIALFELITIGAGALLIWKRDRIRPPGRAELALVVAGVLFALVAGEAGARIYSPPGPYFEELIGRSLDHPLRAFEPHSDITWDIEGLYAGADKIRLRTNGDQFIEPVPSGDAERRVLFLGGSSTEALYVPEGQRWVALLNEPDRIATFNGGASGANILDMYFNYIHFTETLGRQYDLVVLVTAANDFAWVQSLRSYGRTLRLEGYRDALRAWYVDRGRQVDNRFFASLRRRSSLIDSAVRFRETIDRLLYNNFSIGVSPGRFSPTTVVDVYTLGHDNANSQRRVKLEDCASRENDWSEYADDETANMREFADLVANSGARLLVMSESHSYGAPADSFAPDFRQLIRCGNGRLSMEDSYAFANELNRIYLEAARAAGAATFDLASAADAFLSGPEGGRYMYDVRHYTAAGSELVARLIRPVIREHLFPGQTE